MRRPWSFLLWSVSPILLTSATTILGLLAAGAPATAARSERAWAVTAAGLLVVVLVAKAVHDWRARDVLAHARVDALADLHDLLGPALFGTTVLAMTDGADPARHSSLREIAQAAASARATTLGDVAGVRASVFELTTTDDGVDQIVPIGWFGRRDRPRTFSADTTAGNEVFEWLRSPTLGAELYPDVRQRAPREYVLIGDRYRSFIRVPLWSPTGVVFGMVTVDATERRGLTADHQRVAELVSATLEPAFAVLTE